MRVCQESDNELLIASPAKLNLFLELHHRRSDGFHELDTIMTKLGIFDFLQFRATDDKKFTLQVQTNFALKQQDIPSDENNLIIKTLLIMRDLADHSFGAAISLFKNIPVQAGLGGASGNAAAAILAANRLWNLNWPVSRLKEIAAGIGSDVAFFLGDSLARCTGKGEKVQNLHSRCRFNIVVAQPATGMSTGEIYARCEVPAKPTTSTEILNSLLHGNQNSVAKALFNRLEAPAESVSNDVAKMRAEFSRTPCLGHQLTGSGSCYFGIYTNQKSMAAAARILTNRLPEMNILTGQTLA